MSCLTHDRPELTSRKVLLRNLGSKGQRQSLTIAGTGGTEVKKQSRRVRCCVESKDGRFSALIDANVLDNITGNTPAVSWSEVKENWPHLASI